MIVYETDPHRAPDSEFEPGAYHHLAAGNTGRMLDHRRTPVTVTELRPQTGFFVVRVEAFEDAGALWEIPFEKVSNYQFARGSERADESQIRAIRDAVRRFDRVESIPCRPEAAARTQRRLQQERRSAREWLDTRSTFFGRGETFPDATVREGHPALYRDLEAFLDDRKLWDLERTFARQFVSNPYAGDLVKGHRIVMAEMGLVPYEDKVLRDPAALEGAWSRDRRAEHVLARLGFVFALFAKAGRERLELYRGFSTREPLTPPRPDTFVSASFSREVAESHFDAGPPGANRVLVCQSVPIERVFMTYLETEAMNLQFKEAEAVLLFEPGNPAF